MVDSRKDRTHVAFGFRREGKKFGRLVEIGTGRFDDDRKHAHLFLDRLPLGGFTGYVFLAPKGEPPPVRELKPQRPGQSGDDEDEEPEA
jgi:hypothetical protein